MKLTLGFSPCPNDTFIFDALVNKKIDTGEFDFEIFMEDVQTLNQWALQQRLDVSKISYGVYPLIMAVYDLLDSGGALGKGVGPLLISKKDISLSEIADCCVAIPGKDTTAHLLFSLAFPAAGKKEFMIFSSIEEAVLNGSADCGVIIHENRFTYEQKGLKKIMDLGEYWEQQTACPIPLGGIIIRKNYHAGLQQKINSLIRESIEFAFGNYPLLTDYVKEHAREMDEQVMRRHIDLYVNNYSISLGEDGERAVDMLIQVYNDLHHLPSVKKTAPAG